VTVPGASIPYPYGGKQRQVMVDPGPEACSSPKGSPRMTFVTAVGLQNIVLPSGTAKIGEFEYDVAMNASPPDRGRAERPPDQGGRQLDHLSAGTSLTCATAFAPQTNVVAAGTAAAARSSRF